MMVSVVISTRNAGSSIAECLKQLSVQDYPRGQLEVIVADGGSEDDTIADAERCDLKGIPVKVLRLPRVSRASALNAAIRESRGSVICRLDVRTRIGTDYVRRCVETLARTGAENVGGILVPEGSTRTQKAIGWAMAHPFGAGNASFRVGKRSGYVDTVYPGFFRKEALEKVGMFDERPGVISEDSDLNQRIRAGGGKIFLDTQVRVGYEPRHSIGEQGRLYFRYGVARAGNLRKHRRLTAWRQLAAPLLVLALFGFPLLGIFDHRAALVWGAVAASYLGVDVLVASLGASERADWRAFPELCLVFPVMHIAWGLGFWRGLVGPSQRDEQLPV